MAASDLAAVECGITGYQPAPQEDDMTLRPYQETAVRSALGSINKAGSAVLQMPTGAGKTRAATAIIQEYNGVVWFICHRQEIERQASSAFSAAGIDHGIVSPRAKPDFTKRVQIVSVAAKCLAEMPQPSLVIWDECHHVPAKSWAKLHASLPDAKHLGLTATPERLDGKGLKDWFADLIVGPSISDLIEKGFLSPVRYFAPSDPDLTAAKLQAGDYRKKDADAVMNSRVIIGDAVTEYRRSADGKRAIAFCTSVEASKALVDRFNDEGIPAIHVDGASSDDHRRDAIAALTSGEVKVLSNVEVFTEGFDVPVVEAVILLRPTKSATLLLQMIGRALRYVEGKTAIIMDHAGLHQDHGWFASDWQWSIEGGAAKARRMAGLHGPRRCPECKEVRAERLPVCSCGYEFPTGREVGEFDGVLREVRGIVPVGCVSIPEFAKTRAVGKTTVHRWVKSGMPNIGGHPCIPAADQWVSENSSIEKIMSKRPARDGHETRQSFAKRIGRSIGFVNRCISEGMPHDRKTMHVEYGRALAWMQDNRPEPETGDGILATADFAKAIGMTTGRVRSAIKRGLPILPGGMIDEAKGREWVLANMKHQSRPSLDIIDVATRYETRKDFASRLGVSSYYPQKFADMGLPCASNGWIHIQRGLEWVRDNTSIEIPPGAWPSANDNAASARDEAA